MQQWQNIRDNAHLVLFVATQANKRPAARLSFLPTQQLPSLDHGLANWNTLLRPAHRGSVFHRDLIHTPHSKRPGDSKKTFRALVERTRDCGILIARPRLLRHPHLLEACFMKDRRPPSAGRAPATPPFQAHPGEARPRPPPPAAAARKSPTAADSGCEYSRASPPPRADSSTAMPPSSTPLLPSDKREHPRPWAIVADGGAAAVSTTGRVMPGGISTSARRDRSDRRRSKAGLNAAFHAGAGGCFRLSSPKVAFHTSRRHDCKLSASQLLRGEKGSGLWCQKERRNGGDIREIKPQQ